MNTTKLPKNWLLEKRAKELRKAGNLPEVLFWNQVKQKKFLGLDFDRQRVIGNYIVDFYCMKHNLIIEIDGEGHNLQIEYDIERDNFFSSFGLKIIHIRAVDILKNMNGVLEWLKGHEVFKEC